MGRLGEHPTLLVKTLRGDERLNGIFLFHKVICLCSEREETDRRQNSLVNSLVKTLDLTD